MSENKVVTQVEIFDNSSDFYRAALLDISSAQKSIHFEFYRVTKEETGIEFRDLLAEKARQGLKVIVLIDAWGTGSSLSFFKSIIENGGQVRIFNTFRLGTKIFTQSHRRNHRKLIIIDNHISYIGSANISHYSKKWRELILRFEGHIANPLRFIVENDFRYNNRYSYNQKKFTRSIHYHSFEIIRDVPSIVKQRVMKKYLYLIRNAQRDVYIESPYFLPGFRLRKALTDAAQRGVNVVVVMPLNSDVPLVDFIRNRYLGTLHKEGVNILYYKPKNLHSKLLIFDEEIFATGSSNFDYRSFRYMHEIMFTGKNYDILKKLLQYKTETITNTEVFDYSIWLKRSTVEKLIAWLLLPFRYLF